MGFRFRRTFSLSPGLRLNVSKSGLSTSVGVRGAHITLGHGQVRKTVGIPGTGLSYSTVSRVGGGRSNSGSLADLVSWTVWVVRYLPLVALYAAFIYTGYVTIKDWHPVFIALMLVALTWTFFSVIRRFAALISQDAATLIGGMFYGAGMVALKVARLPELDWIWTAALTGLCAVIGAWSYRSCHAAILRLSGASSAAVAGGKNVETGANTAQPPKAKHLISATETVRNTEVLA